MKIHIEPLEKNHAHYQNQRTELQAELSRLRNQLAAAHEGAENSAERLVAEAQFKKLSEEALARSYSGLLIRFVLLHEIIRTDSAALAAYILVSLLLLFWELIPMVVKFTWEPSEYERQIERTEHRGVAELEAAKKLLIDRAGVQQLHKLRMEIMKLDRVEAAAWVAQAEERFEIVQAKRAAIPKRATIEQREAYLSALNVLIASLGRTGEKLLSEND